MTLPFKACCLGVVVAVNGLLASSLAYTWFFIYREHTYPIDFFMPLERADSRATVTLCMAAVSVPLAFVMYARIWRELRPAGRLATLIVSGAAAGVAVAFTVWRYLR